MCPAEFSHVVDGVHDRRKNELALSISGAWYSAAFQRQKRMGKLDKIIAKIFKASPKKSDIEKMIEEQKEVVARMMPERNRG